jgi:hypothetical protein
MRYRYISLAVGVSKNRIKRGSGTERGRRGGGQWGTNRYVTARGEKRRKRSSVVTVKNFLKK